MWIKFLEDFSYIPPNKRNVTIAYKAGGVYNVTGTCRDVAVKQGVAEDTRNPRREEALNHGGSSSEDGDGTLQTEAETSTSSLGGERGQGGGDERQRDAGGSAA